MKQYSITAKRWIKIDADTQEEARAISKNSVDEALYDYVVVNQKVPDVTVGISKAKITWARESEDQKTKEQEDHSGTAQDVDGQFSAQ